MNRECWMATGHSNVRFSIFSFILKIFFGWHTLDHKIQRIALINKLYYTNKVKVKQKLKKWLSNIPWFIEFQSSNKSAIAIEVRNEYTMHSWLVKKNSYTTYV